MSKIKDQDPDFENKEEQAGEQNQISNEELLKKIEALSKELKEARENIRPQTASLDMSNPELLAKIVSEAVKAATASTKTFDETGFKYDDMRTKMYDPSQVDTDDALEEPKVFFSYSCGYVIVDDVKNGYPIPVPTRRPIVFAYHSGSRTGSGKEQNIINISKYVCYSKKEYDFLKAHKFYGVFFHETTKGVNSVDHQEASLIVRYSTMLRSEPASKIIAMAKENEVSLDGIGNDIDKMRVVVAVALAKKTQNAEARSKSITIDNEFKEMFMK